MPRTASSASTSASLPGRNSVSRCRATRSSNFFPGGSSFTRVYRRSSRLRLRLTYPRVSSRSISSTVLLCFNLNLSANAWIVGSAPSGRPRSASKTANTAEVQARDGALRHRFHIEQAVTDSGVRPAPGNRQSQSLSSQGKYISTRYTFACCTTSGTAPACSSESIWRFQLVYRLGLRSRKATSFHVIERIGREIPRFQTVMQLVGRGCVGLPEA